MQLACPVSRANLRHHFGRQLMAVPPLSNPTVVQAQSGIASKLDKKAGKTSFLHHLRVDGAPADFSIGRNLPGLASE